MKLGLDNEHFSDAYKTELRLQWFRMDKPGAKRFYIAIGTDPVTGRKPHFETVQDWITKDFKPFAANLDEQIQDEMNNRLVAEKVEMLERHTATAREMQNLSIEWLRLHKDNLNAISAARLLVSGIEIERMSAGIPKMLEKLANMKDEDLMKRIQDIVSRSPTTIEPMELPEETIDIGETGNE